MATVAVVGGGITGLVAAWALRRSEPAPDVVLFEARDRLGGKVLGTPFAGLDDVEAGPDMFLARLPWALDLCRELGLDDLVSPSTGKAYVWWDGRLQPIPEGLVLGVPTGVVTLARSHLLSWKGKARAGLEPLIPRSDPRDNLGGFIRHRFGREVLERLVDPLVGGINAGDADRLSLRAAAPQIADAALRHRSLLLGLRGMRPPATATPAPLFATPRGGLTRIIDRLVEGYDGEVRLEAEVGALTARPDGRWQVDDVVADAVVLALPAFAASPLVTPVGPDAARLMADIPHASVAVVTLAVPADGFAVPLDASGHLVPKPVQRHLTACSWASTKWERWRRPGQVVLRASLGRFGDDAPIRFDDGRLLDVTLEQLREHLGLRAAPTDVRITRWARAFPQYLPGHHQRVALLRAGLPAGLQVAGAAYDGIGLPACIRQGREAAAAARAHLLR